LRGAASILVSLDFDEAGGRASWQFWLSNYPNAKRWPTPKGKDPGDYYQQGGNIRAWIEAGFSNEKPQNQNDEAVSPFPLQWLQKYDDERLERLAIMTVDGWLSDQEAMRLLN
jgi:DNA primase